MSDMSLLRKVGDYFEKFLSNLEEELEGIEWKIEAVRPSVYTRLIAETTYPLYSGYFLNLTHFDRMQKNIFALGLG
jgi:hypothetical protein